MPSPARCGARPPPTPPPGITCVAASSHPCEPDSPTCLPDRCAALSPTLRRRLASMVRRHRSLAPPSDPSRGIANTATAPSRQIFIIFPTNIGTTSTTTPLYNMVRPSTQPAAVSITRSAYAAALGSAITPAGHDLLVPHYVTSSSRGGQWRGSRGSN